MVIKFENVGLRYGMEPEVLRNLSFEIMPNSFQFLTGASGSGKTSLLRLMLLSLRPTRGLVSIFDKEISSITVKDISEIRQRIGAVFQDFRLLDHLTIYENVALPLHVQGQEKTSYHLNVTELLEWVGLEDRIHAFPPTLSGGEKQRAAIARALIVKPKILLADEPTGNVDPPLARRLLRLFTELNHIGTSVIIATHDLSLMDQYKVPRMVLNEGYLEIHD